MDEYGYPQGGGIPPQQYMQRPVRQGNTMALLALIFAALSLATIITGILPFFFGSLSILFAILARGGEHKLKGGALSGSLISVFSMIAGLVLTVYSFKSISSDPQFKTQLDQAFESIYGVDYDEFTEQMKNYYETGEMPEFMEELQKRNDRFSLPGGTDL